MERWQTKDRTSWMLSNSNGRTIINLTLHDFLKLLKYNFHHLANQKTSVVEKKIRGLTFYIACFNSSSNSATSNLVNYGLLTVGININSIYIICSRHIEETFKAFQLENKVFNFESFKFDYLFDFFVHCEWKFTIKANLIQSQRSEISRQ